MANTNKGIKLAFAAGMPVTGHQGTNLGWLQPLRSPEQWVLDVGRGDEETGTSAADEAA
ncbi:MAG: hypothetical protein ACYDEY_03975 [Acidimicrobiales bacterium]